VRHPQWIPSRADLPGLGLCVALGSLALACARSLPPSPFISDILVALALGVLVLNTPLRFLIGLTLPAAEREPDRYAAGLRFTGKWVLRLGIVLMGLKVQTSFFGSRELLLIGGVALAALPSAFFIAHALGSFLGVRRPMADLLASGTMICGASAVNAVAPVARARRDEQGIAIGVVFLFSIVALIAFRPIAAALALDSGMAGLWSGLAVNDLSSAIAVGAQMGGHGGVMAAASKSARILLLAPMLVVLALLRREGSPVSVKKSVIETLPAFILGYIALAVLRALVDRVAGPSPAWQAVLGANKLAVDLLMSTVSAGIGLHLAIRTLLASSARAVAVGGGASAWMAALTLGMIVAASRGSPSAAALIGLIGMVTSFAAYRAGTAEGRELRLLRARFASGAPLALSEATSLLDAAERDGAFEDTFLKQVLAQLHPSIGELIPVRKSPLPKGEGCRWMTYWEGRSGWALVAVCREPGSFTPIHAHSHRLLGKAIEGVLEELRFNERDDGNVEVASRVVLGHNDLVETNALSTLHIVRVVGPSPAIDLQLRGPEVGRPGRRFRASEPLDFGALEVGSRVHATEEVDDRPGHGGEGAAAGRLAPAVLG
jgi:uncharacterized integral membrane protein (TIGR00698 family)